MTTESQHIEFKESWRDEYQKWICGFANAQGGIITACKNDGFSTPEFRYDASGIWTTFKFEYPERATTPNGQNTTQKTIQKTMQKTIQKLTEQQQAILVYLNEHPNATRKELCAKIPDATMGGIIHNLSRLQELGLLKRIGGRKQGYWQIIE